MVSRVLFRNRALFDPGGVTVFNSIALSHPRCAGHRRSLQAGDCELPVRGHHLCWHLQGRGTVCCPAKELNCRRSRQGCIISLVPLVLQRRQEGRGLCGPFETPIRDTSCCLRPANRCPMSASWDTSCCPRPTNRCPMPASWTAQQTCPSVDCAASFLPFFRCAMAYICNPCGEPLLQL